jgi:transposase-like protein DUF772
MTTLALATNRKLVCNFGFRVRPEPNHLLSPKSSLMSSIQDAAIALEKRGWTAGFADFDTDGHRPRTLLILLCWCYAHGLYASHDIEQAVRRKPELSSLCEYSVPDESVLRQFRRHNWEAICTCLLAALLFKAKEKIASGVVTRINQTHVEAEARRRLIMASFLDSCTLERSRADS